MYKQDLALNDPQGLICHKTKPKQKTPKRQKKKNKQKNKQTKKKQNKQTKYKKSLTFLLIILMHINIFQFMI